MMKRIIILLVAVLAGCQCLPSSPGGKAMERTDLYFGMSRPDGKAIGDDEFHAFVNDAVTPRFPDGLTLLSGDGQWKDPKTRVITHEGCRLLILLHEKSSASDAAIEQIREEYKKRYAQKSVLRADEMETISF